MKPHASPFQLALYHCCLTLWFPFDLEYMHCIACDVMKLYQILTQSSSLWWSYCDFNICPNDLEHHVTCCAWLSDNFHQVWFLTTYPCLNCSIFYADMSPCDLDLWPWKLVVHQALRDQSLYEMWRKSNNSQLNYWQFFKFCTCYVMLWPWPLTS